MTKDSETNSIDLKETDLPLNRSAFLFWTALLLILFSSLLLRNHQIEIRPLHADEGVNFHFLQSIERSGIYDYSHENYHGPIYFWLITGASKIFGKTELGVRAVSIFFGSLLVLLLLPLRKTCGTAFILLSGLFIALSPSMVFFSRYAIHEMLLVFFSTWFAVELYLLFEQKQIFRIYTTALALALVVCTKETYVILGFSLVVSLLLISSISFSKLKDFVGFIQNQWSHVLNALLMFSAVIVLVFSSGLRSIKGIREFFLAVQQWVGRGTSSDVGHFKPFSYYLHDVIWVTEPHLPLAFIAAAAVFAASLLFVSVKHLKTQTENKYSFGIYLFTWTVVTFLVYSLVPYKTVWLVINISLPAILFLSWGISRLFNQGGKSSALGLALTAVLAFAMFKNTLHYNFTPSSFPFISSFVHETKPYGSGNPFSYVHTSPGMLKMLDEIKDYWKLNPKARVLVGVKTYWPLPFYFQHRAKQTGYFVPKTVDKYTKEYNVIIVDKTINWTHPGWKKEYYRLSDVQEANVYYLVESKES